MVMRLEMIVIRPVLRLHVQKLDLVTNFGSKPNSDNSVIVSDRLHEALLT